ncbi:tetratricopeptide repeat protein [Lactobacillus apis]|uniref:tetratricopeptide repeat protein n=1 Tax=Lactobacillus apis TaxID=303541 RepID=UPI00242FFDE4|nr:tetratricopeptide repeat protein [Lactobacillus apis]
MKISFNSKSTILPLTDAKEVVVLSGFIGKTTNPLESSLNFLDLGNMNAKNISLTDSMDFNNEIRFYLSGRRRRAYNYIGQQISNLDEEIIIEIYRCNNLHKATTEFLNHIVARFENIHLSLIEEENSELPEYQLNDTEEKIEKLLLLNPRNLDFEVSQFEFLEKQAQNYLTKGDPFTAEVILNFLFNYSTKPDLYNEMSLSMIMQDKFIESEFYLNEWKKRGTIKSKAYANYALSMLYARHHDGPLKSLETAKKLLIEAQNYLNNVRDVDIKSFEADKEFMLNGYALILFRNGEVDKAIQIEKDAIEKLSYAKKGARLLQRSVLFYNLAQCYTQLKKYDLAIETYKELLHLDKDFPDYYVELAKVYIAKNDFNSAWKELKVAYNIDKTISEVNSLMGYVQMQKGNLVKAARYYKVAQELEYLDPDALYDFVYTLTELDDYDTAFIYIKKFLSNEIKFLSNAKNNQIKVDLISISAEVLVNVGRTVEAKQFLEKWIKIFDSNQLLKNRAILKQD